MVDVSANRSVVRAFIEEVWQNRNLDALPTFWTSDCINHAMPGPANVGLEAVRAYHQQFFAAFSAFSALRIEIEQQVAEGDRVVTQLVTRGPPFARISASNTLVSLATIRIDRVDGGKIAEHWSVADMADLMQQLQSR